MKKLFKIALLSLAFVSLHPLTGFKTSYAGDLEVLGSFGEWTAYSYPEKEGKVCFMTSKPQKSNGNYTKRGEVQVFITHRPHLKSFDVVQFIAGYDYKPGSTAALLIGNETFQLAVKDDAAWAADDKTDHNIVAALKKGSTMIIKGSSKRGTLTTDTYSLVGSGQAYKAISDSCKKQ